jgi:hypothetical protein
MCGPPDDYSIPDNGGDKYQIFQLKLHLRIEKTLSIIQHILNNNQYDESLKLQSIIHAIDVDHKLWNRAVEIHFELIEDDITFEGEKGTLEGCERI